MEKVKCPYCKANTPIWKTKDAAVHGIWFKCKRCHKEFEIIIKK